MLHKLEIGVIIVCLFLNITAYYYDLFTNYKNED
jgi:hypothetical protein